LDNSCGRPANPLNTILMYWRYCRSLKGSYFLVLLIFLDFFLYLLLLKLLKWPIVKTISLSLIDKPYPLLFLLHKVFIITWVVVIKLISDTNFFIGSKKKLNSFPSHYLLKDGNVWGLHFHPLTSAFVYMQLCVFNHSNHIFIWIFNIQSTMQACISFFNCKTLHMIVIR
jgi:hypothetical protein